MTDRHPDEDLLLDLALSDLDELRRDALTGHLALCEPCRARYRALADSVDHVVVAAPPVAPPAGFSPSVLAALGVADSGARAAAGRGPVPGPGRPADSAPGETPEGGAAGSRPAPPGRGRPRRVADPRLWIAAAAAALALLLGAVGATLVLQRSPGVEAGVAAVGPALTTSDGARVGTVLSSRYDGRPVLVLTLTDGPVGARYDCQLVLADGSRVSAGSWVLTEPAGTTWVVPRPDTVTGVDLVSATGATWASAAL